MVVLIDSIKNQREFDLVNKQQNKRFYSDHFTLVIMRSFKKGSKNRVFLGMKVIKKIGNAVIRNKIKRRIRHLFMITMKEYDQYINSEAFILIPKKNFDTTKFVLLLDNLKVFLKRYFQYIDHRPTN